MDTSAIIAQSATSQVEKFGLEPLLNTAQVAEAFNTSESNVRRMIGRGHISAMRIGGEYRVRLSELRRYLEAARCEAIA
jgi:excisionase family DNA binding protein